ncbi:MAG: phosphatase PAP2 family protein [Alphaproteobacteria bacterium]|nr:phosphatase PAP2 family protein [Alphaproteobacteria bacterium]
MHKTNLKKIVENKIKELLKKIKKFRDSHPNCPCNVCCKACKKLCGTRLCAVHQKIKDVFSTLVKKVNLKEKANRFLKYVSKLTVKSFFEDVYHKLIRISKEQPRTALLVYVLLLSAFFAAFIDVPFANYRLHTKSTFLWTSLASINPGCWTILILALIWLGLMMLAGSSITSTKFEFYASSVKIINYIGFSVLFCTVFCAILKFIVGRYSPEIAEQSSKSSGFTLNFAKTSCPSYGVASIFVLAFTLKEFFNKYNLYLLCGASIISLSLLLVAKCYISDAILGAYIGYLSSRATKWFFDQNKENFPIFTRK